MPFVKKKRYFKQPTEAETASADEASVEETTPDKSRPRRRSGSGGSGSGGGGGGASGRRRGGLSETPPRGALLIAFALVMAVYFPVSVVLQHINGAYANEFGGHPDEAAHFVSALMVTDYVKGGVIDSPLGFPRDYYDHYPKIGIGVWPPLFYVVQTCWYLVFGASVTSAFALLALINSSIAAVMFLGARQFVGVFYAFVGGLIFLLIPLVQEYTAIFMLENLVTLLVLASTLIFAKYLENENWRWAVGFALCAAAAISSKGSALSLACVPPVAIALTGRWHMLKRPALWIAAIIVAVLAAPFTIASYILSHSSGWEQSGASTGFFVSAVGYYLGKLYVATGFGLVGFAAGGIVFRVVARGEDTPADAFWASIAGMTLGVYLLHITVPAGHEARHMVPALPGIIIFAMAGVGALAKFLRRFEMPPPVAGFIAAGLAFTLFMVGPFGLSPKNSRGFRPAAEMIAGYDPVNTLISSDARGEGMFISELALAESVRPGHRVRRSSKVLASMEWGGGNYNQLVGNFEELMDFLRREEIAFLVVDTTVPAWGLRPDHEFLEAVIASHPGVFQRVKAYTIVRNRREYPDGVVVYRVP